MVHIRVVIHLPNRYFESQKGDVDGREHWPGRRQLTNKQSNTQLCDMSPLARCNESRSYLEAQLSSLAACLYKAEQPLASTLSSTSIGRERAGARHDIENQGRSSHPVGFFEYHCGTYRAACRGAASVLQRTGLATHRAKSWKAPTTVRSSITSASPNSCSCMRLTAVVLARLLKHLEFLW